MLDSSIKKRLYRVLHNNFGGLLMKYIYLISISDYEFISDNEKSIAVMKSY